MLYGSAQRAALHSLPMRHSAFAVGIILAFAGIGVAGADYVLKERPHDIAMQQQNPDTTGTTTSEAMMSSSASSMFVKKGVSTKKSSGVDVPTALASLQLVPTQTSETGLLGLSVQGGSVQTMVLLLNNDRAALFSWIQDDDVKTIFNGLKQALQEQFSPKLSGLVDETVTQDKGPIVDILSFTDPAISAEKVVFLRVRTRLYEVHITPKSEATMQRLIEELKK